MCFSCRYFEIFRYSRGAVVGSVNLPPYGDEDTLDTVKTALMNAQSAGHVVVIVDNEHLQRAKKVTDFFYGLIVLPVHQNMQGKKG